MRENGEHAIICSAPETLRLLELGGLSRFGTTPAQTLNRSCYLRCRPSQSPYDDGEACRDDIQLFQVFNVNRILLPRLF